MVIESVSMDSSSATKFVHCNAVICTYLNLQCQCVTFGKICFFYFIKLRVKYFDHPLDRCKSTFTFLSQAPILRNASYIFHSTGPLYYCRVAEETHSLRSNWRKQGCQMVNFRTKNSNFGSFLWAMEWKIWVYFMTIGVLLSPFGVLYLHFV
jgi:hypothetical protein